MWLNHTLPAVRRRLAQGDAKMKKEYELQAALRGIGVEHIFSAGDLVLVRQLRIGKLRPKAEGPYYFLRYRGKLKAVAVVRTQEGRVLEFAAGHLIPVVPGTRLEETRAAAPPSGGT